MHSPIISPDELKNQIGDKKFTKALELYDKTTLRIARIEDSDAYHFYRKRRFGAEFSLSQAEMKREGLDFIGGSNVQTILDIDNYSWHWRNAMEYHCSCGKCRGAKPCAHAAALALRVYEFYQIEDYLDEVNKETDSQALYAMDTLTNDHKTLDDYDNEVEPGSIRIVPELQLGDAVNLAFVIYQGSAHYRIKDLGQFLAAVHDETYLVHGKNIAFTHKMASFDEQSKRAIKLMDEAFTSLDYNNAIMAERISRKNYYDTSRAETVLTGQKARKTMLLGPHDIEKFFALYDGEILVYNLDKYSAERIEGIIPKKSKLQVVAHPSSAQWRIQLQLLQQNNGFVLDPKNIALTYFFNNAVCVLTRNLQFFIITKDAMVSLEDYSRVFATFNRYLNRLDTIKWFSKVYPRVSNFVKAEVPDELQKLLPDPVEISFKVDLDEVGNQAIASLFSHYGERKFAVSKEELDNLEYALESSMQAKPRMRTAEEILQGAPLQLEEIKNDAKALGINRDVTIEQQAYGLMSELFPNKIDGRHFGLPLKRSNNLPFLLFEVIPALERFGDVDVDPEIMGMVHERPQINVSAHVRSNLLEITISSDDVPQDEIYALLNAYRQRKVFHIFKDGSYVDLRNVDLEGDALLLSELNLSAKDIEQGQITLPSYRAFMLDRLVDNMRRSKDFDDYVRGVKSIDLKQYKVPKTIEGTLRPYQVEGYQWLCGLDDMGLAGILADEMGLGKTFQTISYIAAHIDEGRVLIACPASLVYNWKSEFARFAPTIEVETLTGTKSERAALVTSDTDVLISSYDVMRRDFEQLKEGDFNLFVLDEAQFVKNANTQQAKAAKAIPAKHRLALTGTPIENRLQELWSIFDFLMPGLLGNEKNFTARFANPIIGGNTQAMETLRQIVKPFIMRRLKRDVLRDLPDKNEQVIKCELEGEQRKLYIARERALIDHINGQTPEEFKTKKIEILAELTRLRQLCLDPALVYEDYNSGSSKLDAVLELINNVCEGQEKALVFSQFVSYLQVIADKLDELGIPYYTITGATPKVERMRLVDEFNQDQTPIFLISLKAGGTGLNLTGANVVIHADPWWNVAVQNQATDRAHRIGQTKNVTVYKVICQDTIEDRILSLQEAKSALVEDVVGAADGSSLGSLSSEDLMSLLRY